MISIETIRAQLARKKIDALIVTRNNMFLGQDIRDDENKIRALCGFSGSAGTLLIMADKVYLLVDGRYELQAARETVGKQIEVVVLAGGETLADWMQAHLPRGIKIAYNPWCHAISEVDYWKRALRRFEFAEDEDQLTGALLSDVPAEIFEHKLEFAGVSMDEKISYLTEFIREHEIDAYFLCAADSVSWLLNLRSDALPDTPVIRAFALVNRQGEVSLFTADFNKLAQELKAYKGGKVGVAYSQTPRRVYSLMKKLDIWVENLPNPVQKWKAVKNPVEISGMEKAHQRDGLALVKFLSRLENNFEGEDELSVVQKLYRLRAEGENFYGNSFETIAGFGSNGAVVHYQPNAETNLSLKAGSLLLLDSGAQYFDGTTDVTRTVALGQPQPEMIRDFTTVLKAHIALASTRFPQGTTGQSLDAVARSRMWKEGLDYKHGTGHGVGCFLNVHEGPQSISLRSSSAPLEENMVLSIEPGCYHEGKYGIRIENLVRVCRDGESKSGTPLFKFKALTLVPIDKSLIDKYLLDQEELAWLNSYHREVLQAYAEQLSGEEKTWLEKACAPL